MKPPKNVKLVSAEYGGECKYKFTFSNKVISVVNFKPIIFHSPSLQDYLNIDKFKKIHIDKERGDIYWGKDFDMCFHIDSYYGETEVRPSRSPFRLGVESKVKIKSVKYLECYKLQITFNDGHCNVFDYKSIVTSGHEESQPYLDLENFKKFKIIHKRKEIAWGENEDDMMLPLETLYLKSRVNKLCKKVQGEIEKFAKEYSKANKKMSFQELTRLSMEQLSKQRKITLEIALAQMLRIKERRNKENKKK